MTKKQTFSPLETEQNLLRLIKNISTKLQLAWNLMVKLETFIPEIRNKEPEHSIVLEVTCHSKARQRKKRHVVCKGRHKAVPIYGQHDCSARNVKKSINTSKTNSVSIKVSETRYHKTRKNRLYF